MYTSCQILFVQGQLFDGLEEEEDLGFGGETFVPRRSVKKLVLKKGGGGGSMPSRSGLQLEAPPSPRAGDRSITPITR